MRSIQCSLVNNFYLTWLTHFIRNFPGSKNPLVGYCLWGVVCTCVIVIGEMLLRCGGNVIEVGRRQIVVLGTAVIVLLMVSVLSIGFLHSVRPTDADWIQPTPIDQLLPRRAVRGRRFDKAEHVVDELESPKHKDEMRRKMTGRSGGRAFIFVYCSGIRCKCKR